MEKKKENKTPTHIFKEWKSSHGSGESTIMKFVTTVKTGKTEIVLRHEVTKRIPIQKLEEAEKMFYTLSEKSPQRIIELEDLVKMK